MDRRRVSIALASLALVALVVFAVREGMPDRALERGDALSARSPLTSERPTHAPRVLEELRFGGSEDVLLLAAASDGDAVIVASELEDGRARITRLATPPGERWRHELDERPHFLEVAGDHHGGAVVAASLGDSARHLVPSSMRVLAIDAEGRERWRIDLDVVARPTALATDEHGSVVVAGDARTPIRCGPLRLAAGPFVLGLRGAGECAWAAALDPGVGAVDTAVFRRGRVLVGGGCAEDCYGGALPPDTAGGFLAQLDGSGREEWARPLSARAQATCATADGVWVEGHDGLEPVRLLRLSSEGDERRAIPIEGDFMQGTALSCREDAAFFTAWVRGALRIEEREVRVSPGLIGIRLEGDAVAAFDYLVEGWDHGLFVVDGAGRASVFLSALESGRANDGSRLGYPLRPEGLQPLWLRWSTDPLAGSRAEGQGSRP